MRKSSNCKWMLLAKHLSGESNEDESKELQKILSDNPNLESVVNTLYNFWHTNNQGNTEILEKSWDSHVQRMIEKGILLKRKP
ncbi:MAG: hypothetical protein JST86_18250 [Bacteroidetes bacterium]|nr:hypothetical protein [Bacteroidota bacterium]